MSYKPVYYFNDEAEKSFCENDYPWIEFNINGMKYDVNSKYLYGTDYND